MVTTTWRFIRRFTFGSLAPGIPQMSFRLLVQATESKGYRKLGFKTNLLVFGDELNDLELFDYAGMVFAMGHSHQSIEKQIILQKQ